MKFKEENMKAAERKWVKKYMKKIREVVGVARNALERTRYLKKISYSEGRITKLEQERREVYAVLETKIQSSNIREPMYNSPYKLK